MDIYRKTKLINYLYPTEEIAKFLFCNVYSALKTILPRKVCFSDDNYNETTRNRNYIIAKNTIANFLEETPFVRNKLNEYYLNKEVDNLVNDILYGYLLYLTPKIHKGTGADIFRDKRSVCYSPFSMLDII